ncbi:MAG: ABC transporter ATP-binding protein [Lactobacillales bacterium]|jgi:putative ABC transport system ATP-binding protein|nr:ABC transporter ATP-binding protein [Lactobacillales bacterium]
MIQVENVSKTFEKQQVLSDIDLTINEGELLCFAGPSGVGKTTLLNIVSLIERPSMGRVEIDGIYKWTPSVIQKLRREKIGYVFQNYGLIENDTVQQNLLLTSKFVLLNKNERRTAFAQALDEVGLSEMYLNRKVYGLSGGEQQRVALARLLITKPKYIFADEPTGNLDAENKEMVFQILEKFARNHHTVVYVSHDEDLIKRADRVIYLKNE